MCGTLQQIVYVITTRCDFLFFVSLVITTQHSS